MRGLQQSSSMLHSGGAAAARQFPWPCAPGGGCARVAAKPDYASVIIKVCVQFRGELVGSWGFWGGFVAALVDFCVDCLIATLG